MQKQDVKYQYVKTCEVERENDKLHISHVVSCKAYLVKCSIYLDLEISKFDGTEHGMKIPYDTGQLPFFPMYV